MKIHIWQSVSQVVSHRVIVLTPGVVQILNKSPDFLECYCYNVLIKIARTYKLVYAVIHTKKKDR